MSEVNPHYNQSTNVIHGSVQVVEVEAEPLPRSIKLGWMNNLKKYVVVLDNVSKRETVRKKKNHTKK